MHECHKKSQTSTKRVNEIQVIVTQSQRRNKDAIETELRKNMQKIKRREEYHGNIIII